MTEFTPGENKSGIGIKIGGIVLLVGFAAGEVVGWTTGIKPVSLEQLAVDCGFMGVGLCVTDLSMSRFSENQSEV